MSEEKTVTKKVIETKERPQRKQRNSITGTRTKLSLTGEEPGFHYAWINDDNTGTALDAGYEFVSHDIKVGNKHIDISSMQGAKISRNVGGGVIAYLMRVPQEWYDEDMAAEQREKVDAKEQQIFVENNSNGLTGTLVRGWDKDTPDIFKGK
jgi:hypothetical protein